MPQREAVWYGEERAPWHWRAAAVLFGWLAAARRRAYEYGLLRVHRLPIPVIVVGNLAAGGTGKTPVVLWLADLLQSSDYRPGIVSRGYGGSHRGAPMLVTSDTDPALAGDEPVLLARRAGLPVAIGRNRPAAARFLHAEAGVNVVISDDGLQHYALGRDIEICVLDGERRLGNGRLLPAGPLREDEARLEQVDFVVVNGEARNGQHGMELIMQDAWALSGHQHKPLSGFSTTPVHAVAGIGNPARFFAQLKQLELEVIPHAFPDHHRFTHGDLQFSDHRPILMTEKDAVKCRSLEPGNAWAIPVDAALPRPLGDAILTRLNSLKAAGERGIA